MRILCFLGFLLVLLNACTNKYAKLGYRDDRTITESLFDYKDRTISEADIQRILDGKIEPPDTVRIAVYKYQGQVIRRTRYGYYDEDRIKLEQQIIDTLVNQIRTSKRVQKVLVMPFVLTGNQPNIHQLREAAVRVQADMLLVFSLESDLYQRYRALKKDEAKAYATCEAVLMDIRTGIMPHTSLATREFFGKKESVDLTLDDMRRRVQNIAVLGVMGETGKRLATYLNGN